MADCEQQKTDAALPAFYVIPRDAGPAAAQLLNSIPDDDHGHANE
jgi:hypothetical protein